jgi:hypothetical protein
MIEVKPSCLFHQRVTVAGACVLVLSAPTLRSWPPGSLNHPGSTGGSKQGHTEKTPVLTLVNMVTGEVRSQVVPLVTGATLRKATSPGWAQRGDHSFGRQEVRTET